MSASRELVATEGSSALGPVSPAFRRLRLAACLICPVLASLFVGVYYAVLVYTLIRQASPEG